MTVLGLKSWRQIHLSPDFRILSVYWGIIKYVGERLDILCQNIVEIHTILYQTTKETSLVSTLKLVLYLISTRLILNLEFHYEWNSRKIGFSECTAQCSELCSDFWDSLLYFKSPGGEGIIKEINNEVTPLTFAVQYSHYNPINLPFLSWEREL